MPVSYNENMKKERNILIVMLAAATLILTLIDGFLKPDYLLKSVIKIAVFSITLFIYIRIFDRKLFFLRFSKKNILTTFALALGMYALIIGGYMMLRSFIDFSKVTGKLMDNVKVSKDNFLYVSLYISFINSFLEEIFYRGFGFLMLRRVMNHKGAMLISSLCFAIYHCGMLEGWFNIFLYLLMIAGLVIGGIFFCMLDYRDDHIYHSWLVHMFVNFAINTIGFILFGIL